MTVIVVSYDIADDRRRRRIFKLMKDYGSRVQYSVFECLLDDSQFRELRQQVTSLIHPKEDSVRYYPLCAECREKRLISGYGKMVEEESVYMV